MKKIIIGIMLMLWVMMYMPIPSARAEEFRLVCESSFRGSIAGKIEDRQQMYLDVVIPEGPIPEIALAREQVEARYRDFVLNLSHDRGTVCLDIRDAKTGQQLQRFLWQFFSGIPENTFQSTGQGFTGLIYINHPETQSEMQIICRVE